MMITWYHFYIFYGCLLRLIFNHFSANTADSALNKLGYTSLDEIFVSKIDFCMWICRISKYFVQSFIQPYVPQSFNRFRLLRVHLPIHPYIWPSLPLTYQSHRLWNHFLRSFVANGWSSKQMSDKPCELSDQSRASKAVVRAKKWVGKQSRGVSFNEANL